MSLIPIPTDRVLESRKFNPHHDEAGQFASGGGVGGAPKTREVQYHSLGDGDIGDILANRPDGVFVVVSSRPAQWHGEDADIYAHIDTWYTIRDASPAEHRLWDEALAATTARRELRKRLGADAPSYQFDLANHQLVSTLRRLDSYDDRWNPSAPVVLGAEGFTIEWRYLEAFRNLKGH